MARQARYYGRVDGLVEKLDIVYTPKHGSWLNIAEIEFAAMNTQCIGGRIDDADMLGDQLGAWETDRNDASRLVDWQFTTDDARIKRRRWSGYLASQSDHTANGGGGGCMEKPARIYDFLTFVSIFSGESLSADRALQRAEVVIRR